MIDDDDVKGCGKDCYLCMQSCYCYRAEYGEEAYQRAWAITVAKLDQDEAKVRDSRAANDDPPDPPSPN
jgi:hypothetical protein